MRSVIRFVSVAALALGLLAPSLASAGPVRIHDPFHEGGRFTVKDLRLGPDGHTLITERGGRVAATLELNHDCRACGGASNQVIVGIGGEPDAQACVWNGGARPTGWRTVRFDLDVPDVPGVYEVRVRYAQARSCRDALSWWRVDRPGGPTGASTIGVIVVEGPPPPPMRTTREILPQIDRTLDELVRTTRALVRLSGDRRVNAPRVRKQSERAQVLSEELAVLQAELKAAILRGDRMEHRDPRPRFPRPEVIHVREPVVLVPEPLTPQSFGTLLRRIDEATFANAQLNTIRDHLNAGAYFLTSQAVAVLAKFPHDTHKVEAAALLCPYIVEPGPLPDLLAAFTFESYRDELRQKTNSVCGWQPE